MYLDNNVLTDYIGEHPHLFLTYDVDIVERYQFLFLRLMVELKQLSSKRREIEVYYIDVDEETSIPTPALYFDGVTPKKLTLLCDRYQALYQDARHYC